MDIKTKQELERTRRNVAALRKRIDATYQRLLDDRTAAIIYASHDPVSLGTGGLTAKLTMAAGQVLTLGAINHADLSNVGASDHHAPISLGTGGLTSKLSLAAGQVLTLGAIDHADLSNVSTVEHVDHSAVSITAGDGLTGGGNIEETRTVSLSTPGTLSHSSTNSASGNHTHAVTARSNPGEADALLKTTGQGLLTLYDLTVTHVLQVPGAMGIGGTLTINQDHAAPTAAILFEHADGQAYMTWDGSIVQVTQPLVVSGALTIDGTLDLGPGNKTVQADGNVNLQSGASNQVTINNFPASFVVYSSTEPANPKLGMIWVETA